MRTALVAASSLLATLLVVACGGGTPAPITPAPAAAASSAAPEASTTAAPTASATTSAPEAPPIVGGACEYQPYAGTCEITGAQHFTFRGKIDGKDVVLVDNHLEKDGGVVGTKSPCEFRAIKVGTCTPCMMSIGSCGAQAWDAFRGLKR